MDIIQLIDRYHKIDAEVVEAKKRFPLKDKVACVEFAALNRELKDIDSQISAKAREIVNDQSLDYSDVTDAFAQAINKAAEEGASVEDVILGKDSILDLETVSYRFRIVRSEGKKFVMGGELSAQCKVFPWLLLKINTHGVDGDPIWYDVDAHLDRPYLRGPVGCGFNLDGAYQRAMLAFFRREYARQQG